MGIERREIVEEDLVAGLLGRLEVDGVHLDEGEIALAFLGGRIWPEMVSPVRKSKRRIWEGET